MSAFITKIVGILNTAARALAHVVPHGLQVRGRAFVRRYWGTPMKIALVVLAIFVLFAVVRGVLSHAAPEEAAESKRIVTVLPASLSLIDASLFTISGEVLSQTQGDLRTHSAGVVTAVYANAGDFVAAGKIIAVLENANEAAGVAQAKAGVAQATASLHKVAGGTREEQLRVLAASTQSAKNARDEAYTAARNTLANAYAVTDTAFAGGVDAIFNNPTTANPTLAFNTTEGTARILAQHKRFLLQSTIEAHRANTSTYVSDEQLLTTLDSIEKDLRIQKELLDQLIITLNGATLSQDVTTTTLATYSATAQSARTSVLTMLSTISSTRSAVRGAESAYVIAQENEALGVVGAQNEDVEVAQAQLAAAQAQLAQAYARLEDTYIRALVPGTLTRLSIKTGDFVSAYQDVGLVANENALLIRAYVSPEVTTRLTVGSPVAVDARFEGVITSIARSIDPTTRQIEVRIALADSHANALINGTRVQLAFSSEAIDPTQDVLRIPVAALKLVGSDAFVLTVNALGLVESTQVELGAVSQNSVEIRAGITPQTLIVVDARGVQVGDVVDVQANN